MTLTCQQPVSVLSSKGIYEEFRTIAASSRGLTKLNVFAFQGSLEEWLRLLRLEEYGPALVAQGYRTVHDVTQLAWEVSEKTTIWSR